GGGSISEPLLRESVFQVVSVMTTSGFTTSNTNLWPSSLKLMLLGLMFVGACMGSTSGAMKITRFIIYGKVIWRELHRLIFPHAIRPVRVGPRVIEPAMVLNVFAFGAVYVILFALGSAVMGACGYDMVTAMSASAAVMGN